MKVILRILARLLGVVFMAAAFVQWVTFEYPNINPWWVGAVFAPSVVSQVVNWILVCVLATAGWGFFTYGKFRLDRKG